MAIRKPSPDAPRSAEPGTAHSSNESGTVFEARSPIFCSCGPMVSPGVPASTRKAEIPLVPGAGSVRAQTTITPA